MNTRMQDKGTRIEQFASGVLMAALVAGVAWAVGGVSVFTLGGLLG